MYWRANSEKKQLCPPMHFALAGILVSPLDHYQANQNHY